jgi:hypothetical protein
LGLATEKIGTFVSLLAFMIQLIGSAPSVSNFASYSGVLIVIIRFGAAVALATGADGETAG